MKNICETIVAVVVFGAAMQCGAGEFEASFAGRQLSIHPARVSAFPMNQVWSGYQRPVEQTKMTSPSKSLIGSCE